jgi:hypothetical protein
MGKSGWQAKPVPEQYSGFICPFHKSFRQTGKNQEDFNIFELLLTFRQDRFFNLILQAGMIVYVFTLNSIC